MIKRAKLIELKYQNAQGEDKVVSLEGLASRCVQHEVDHLNGIIFLQRASRLKLDRALKSRPKERAKRIEYEKRQALAKYIQSMQSKDDTTNVDTVADDTASLQNNKPNDMNDALQDDRTETDTPNVDKLADEASASLYLEVAQTKDSSTELAKSSSVSSTTKKKRKVTTFLKNLFVCNSVVINTTSLFSQKGGSPNTPNKDGSPNSAPASLDASFYKNLRPIAKV